MKQNERPLVTRLKCDDCKQMVTRVVALEGRWLCDRCGVHTRFVTSKAKP